MFNLKAAEIARDVVTAAINNRLVAAGDIQDLIKTTYATVSALTVEPVASAEPGPKLTPPVSVKKTITPDYLISLEDGQRYKSLKRHLTARGLMPVQYREKWALPSNYPMVAPNYAKQRSDLAKSMGLGRKREPEPVATPIRRRKAA